MLVRIVLLLPLLSALNCAAAPHIPGNQSQILERLPTIAASADRELRRLQADLSRKPGDLDQAITLAWRYLTLGRAEADPRYYGYAEAALKPWLQQQTPPPKALLLRATLRQNRHDFERAVADLDTLLAIQPRNAQALLTRATILTVRGDLKEARRTCARLAGQSSNLIVAACAAHAASLNGQAQQSYRLLHKTLQHSDETNPNEQQWALGILADIAVRLGHGQEAERYFRSALELNSRDVYLLAAFADFLLENKRADEVRRLLADKDHIDILLLRLALAEQRLDPGKAQRYAATLHKRFEAGRRRGDGIHAGLGARLYRELLNQPDTALDLARRNWAEQREPADARLVLETALAANKADAARPVLDWLASTGLEDVRLTRLVNRLEDKL